MKWIPSEAKRMSTDDYLYMIATMNKEPLYSKEIPYDKGGKEIMQAMDRYNKAIAKKAEEARKNRMAKQQTKRSRK